MLGPESDHDVVRSVHPDRMPPLECGMDDRVSHTSHMFDFHFVGQFVGGAIQLIACVVFLSRTPVCVPVFTFTTAAHGQCVEVTFSVSPFMFI